MSSRPARVGILACVLFLTGPAGAREPRTLHLRFPRLAVPAGANTEACVFLRLPAQKPFELASWDIRTRSSGAGLGTLHFLVYVYTGERLAEFSKDAGHIVPSRGCLDLGPVDRDRRQLVASGFARTRGALPQGVALSLNPVPAVPGGPPEGIGLLLDGNWSNGGSRTRYASARVVLHRAPVHTVRRLAQPIFERSAEIALDVPPNVSPNEGHVMSTETSTAAYNTAHPEAPPVRDTWGAGITGGPAGDACVLMLTGHMHKRGRFFGVDLIGSDGQVNNPVGGFPNRFEPGRSHLFAAVDYTDPGILRFSPPQPLRATESLHYACWDDNGVTTPVRLGCEETQGVTPGRPGNPAKPCTFGCPGTDPEYPGRTFTGACVPANLVAGETPDDEVCALAGWYFDAAPGSGCDVTGLPALR